MSIQELRDELKQLEKEYKKLSSHERENNNSLRANIILKREELKKLGGKIEGTISRKTSNELMQFFAYEHLPKDKQHYSKPFGILAKMLDENLPDNSEKTAALKRLLEAKDCAVRSSFQK